MAINTQHMPNYQVRLRQRDVSRYLSFNSGRYFIHAVVLLCLMSLLTLGQTGILATRGYVVADLEQQRVELLRMRDQLEVRYAEAQSLERIRARANQIGLRPMEREQAQYISITNPTVTNLATTNTISPPPTRDVGVTNR